MSSTYTGPNPTVPNNMITITFDNPIVGSYTIGASLHKVSSPSSSTQLNISELDVVQTRGNMQVKIQGSASGLSFYDSQIGYYQTTSTPYAYYLPPIIQN